MEEKKKIKVYSTPFCPYCSMVKDFLKKKDVEFEDIDVSIDQEAARKMIGKSGSMGVPQIEINDKIIVGFDQNAIERELQNV
ncbi:thioredoxin family protein [candidate division WOR-3 bacterium]|nr:thioredoxin family protein [candidate division WOR-3 bacterium]